MVIITVTEFKNNTNKYIALALKEKVALKSKLGVIELIPSKDKINCNPSPSSDPWFEIPENISSIERGRQQAKDGLGTTLEELKQKFSL